jgi:hypothetical protein
MMLKLFGERRSHLIMVVKWSVSLNARLSGRWKSYCDQTNFTPKQWTYFVGYRKMGVVGRDCRM